MNAEVCMMSMGMIALASIPMDTVMRFTHSVVMERISMVTRIWRLPGLEQMCLSNCRRLHTIF